MTVTGEGRVRGLVDTNVLIHLVALDPSVLPDELVISAVTLAELSAGPHLTDDPIEKARRTSVLQHAEATFTHCRSTPRRHGHSAWSLPRFGPRVGIRVAAWPI